MAEQISIDTMSRDDLNVALDWAAAEGWNPGLHDAAAFHAADPTGFLIGKLGGEPIACISTVAYDDAFGFLGLYIVKPAFRGKGYGMQIWQAGMAYLGKRNVGLDGVVAQQANYQKSGFQLAYRNIRHEGIAAGMTIPPWIVDLNRIPLDDLLAYDRQCFPAARPAFLRHWIPQPGAVALGYQRDKHLSGYGVIRPCRNGFKIGPLFADNANDAEDLYQALAAHAGSRPIFLDTPDSNPEALALARRNNLKPVFECARMYTAGPPAQPMKRIFGTTTLELG